MVYLMELLKCLIVRSCDRMEFGNRHGLPERCRPKTGRRLNQGKVTFITPKIRRHGQLILLGRPAVTLSSWRALGVERVNRKRGVRSGRTPVGTRIGLGSTRLLSLKA
jgi:hypothetical protein